MPAVSAVLLLGAGVSSDIKGLSGLQQQACKPLQPWVRCRSCAGMDSVDSKHLTSGCSSTRGLTFSACRLPLKVETNCCLVQGRLGRYW